MIRHVVTFISVNESYKQMIRRLGRGAGGERGRRLRLVGGFLANTGNWRLDVGDKFLFIYIIGFIHSESQFSKTYLIHQPALPETSGRLSRRETCAKSNLCAHPLSPNPINAKPRSNTSTKCENLMSRTCSAHPRHSCGAVYTSET